MSFPTFPKPLPHTIDPDDLDQEVEVYEVKSFWLSLAFAGIQTLFFGLVTLYILSRPAVFVFLYHLLRPQESMADVQALIQWMNSLEDIIALNSSIREGNFPRPELDHYRDVRDYLHLGQILLLPSAFIWGVVTIAVFNFRFLSFHGVQVFFLKLSAYIAVACLIWILIDWSSFFHALHYPLFGLDSWRFPANAHSLKLFPEWFWGVMGVIFVMIPLSVAGILALFSQSHPPPKKKVDMRLPIPRI